MHTRDITRIEKTRQFIKISIDCKDQMFCLLSFRQTYVKTKMNQQCFMETQGKS